MSKIMTLKKAVSFIEEQGVLLVFPINNRKEPRSLWGSFFPRSEMKWEWDQNGDTRVSDLWMLREALSRSEKVVYSKWYRGRATFFSRELFTAMLNSFEACGAERAGLGREAAEILEILELDSPQSTKALKKAADLQGKFYEAKYTRALKELWQRCLIVGFGEVDDGAFPSLSMGATKNLFEDLYQTARSRDRQSAREGASQVIEKFMPAGSLFRKYFDEVQRKLAAAASNDEGADDSNKHF